MLEDNDMAVATPLQAIKKLLLCRGVSGTSLTIKWPAGHSQVVPSSANRPRRGSSLPMQPSFLGFRMVTAIALPPEPLYLASRYLPDLCREVPAIGLPR